MSYDEKTKSLWMGKLSGSLRLCDIVVPGSHNSHAYHARYWLLMFGATYAWRCQNRSIYDQLCLGIRALDLRMSDDVYCSHGPIVTIKFETAISDIVRFAAEYPNEIILVFIKSEWRRTGSSSDKVSKKFTSASSRVLTDFEPTVTLSELRSSSKNILLFWNYSPIGNKSWRLEDSWAEGKHPTVEKLKSHVQGWTSDRKRLDTSLLSVGWYLNQTNRWRQEDLDKAVSILPSSTLRKVNIVFLDEAGSSDASHKAINNIIAAN